MSEVKSKKVKEETPSPIITINDQYDVMNKIGSGTFGTVYIAIDNKTTTKVAVKMEARNTGYVQLWKELKVYMKLKGTVGFPNIYYYGKQKEYNFLVMDLLGPSLDVLLNRNGFSFSLKTKLLLIDQMITRLQEVHDIGIIHRDIKPSNFAMGLGPRKYTVYLIDFGLSNEYRDSKTKKHIKFAKNMRLVGTPRFVSANMHKGYEQSRRDDMESLGYLIILLLSGDLPWESVSCKDSANKYKIMKETKLNMSLEDLCAGLPVEVLYYFKYVRKLKFEERPNYVYCRRIFRKFFLKHYKYDFNFDWTLYQPAISTTPSTAASTL